MDHSCNSFVGQKLPLNGTVEAECGRNMSWDCPSNVTPPRARGAKPQPPALTSLLLS